MPTKRRKTAPLAVLKLSPAMHSHLLTGSYLLPGPKFHSEEHRQAAWERHREAIIEAWHLPGKRPAALWDYDLGDWSKYGKSEEEAVVKLLRAGKLTSCKLCGVIPIMSELAEIEARRWIA